MFVLGLGGIEFGGEYLFCSLVLIERFGFFEFEFVCKMGINLFIYFM